MRILLGIVLGLVIGWVATTAAVLIYGEMAHVSQAEGAFAMGAIFLIGPVGGVAGTVAGGILGMRWARRARAR
ncbi:hypothetical protein [Roseomonas rosulenta]|uniref:hypothetical protein n=1 Tax=Roseomonas rosulenta TaxID=2748667 RepID=UPI0018DF411A|nr:hypothetical protein [Roseomonas rosulenta]